MTPTPLLAGICLLVAIAAFIIGRKSRDGECERATRSLSHKDYLLAEAKRRIDEVGAAYRTLEVDAANRRQKLEVAAAQRNAEIRTLNEALAKSSKREDELSSFIAESLERLRGESALLPYAVRWIDRLQRYLDEEVVARLASPPNPAPKSAQQVRQAKAQAREAKLEAELLRNRVELYERQAPWLRECADYTLEELIEGIKEAESLKHAYATGDDPARLFLTATEWSSLTTSEKNQLALDRYWEGSRSRTAWVAGVQYERFVGHHFESSGHRVEYHGATQGKHDLGIDLICADSGVIFLIQCKRLSPSREVPVRENTVAQIYGAAMFYAMVHGLDKKTVRPCIFTTYQLSEQASQFAKLLGVTTEERFEFRPYPCIKCNVSQATGEWIYHLPFDQQYDRVIIDRTAKEFYATTVREAEARGFRRAYKWTGD